MIGTYQDLLETALASDEPQRLLVVLLQTERMQRLGADATSPGFDGEGTLTPAMARDFAIDADLDFTSLVCAADQAAPGWCLMMTAVLVGRRGQPPAAEEAAPHLKRMANAVMTGEQLERYVFFDRDGDAVRLKSAGHG